MMKAKPRWMKSAIETASKYAVSNAPADPRDAAKQSPKPNMTEKA